MWDTTVARARRLPAEQLDVRVGDGWSFVETLRHLVFVTDGWIRRLVEEQPAPHHPFGLPPHFIDGRTLGLDLDAHPTLDDVLHCRRERMIDVRDLVTRSTASDLQRACGNGFTVLGAIQVVVFEEWAHHHYATRDLAQLETR
jgi:DinB superfamily